MFIFSYIYSRYRIVLRFVKTRNYQYNEKKYYFCIVKQEKTYGDSHAPNRSVPLCCPFFSTFFQKTPQDESLKTLMFSTCSEDFISFTFTGKEKDCETGYYAFGARYYDCDLSGLFLSVDPMADRYPSLSPYAYCAWNPVKLVDPDGMTWETDEDKEKAETIKKETTNKISDLEEYKISLEGKIKSGNISEKKKNALEYELSETTNQILLLSDFIKGIDELSGSDIRYTFNPTRSPINKVKPFARSGTLYKINYQSGNEGNQVHETVHAIQVDRMVHNRIDEMSLIEMEQGAYSTQYSFSPNSMPRSYHQDNPSSRISADWVRQIYIYYNGVQMPYKNL